MKKFINIILLGSLLMSCGKIKVEPKKIEGDIQISDSVQTIRHEIAINLDNIIDVCGHAYEENSEDYSECVSEYSKAITDLISQGRESLGSLEL